MFPTSYAYESVSTVRYISIFVNFAYAIHRCDDQLVLWANDKAVIHAFDPDNAFVFQVLNMLSYITQGVEDIFSRSQQIRSTSWK